MPTVNKVPNEGETYIANLLFKVNNTELLLFTNTGLTDTVVYADLIEPSTFGYARKTLSAATWVVTADTGTGTTGVIVTYPNQIFIPSGGIWTGIYGVAIVTTGGSPKIISITIDGDAPITLLDGVSYTSIISIPIGRLT